MEQAWRAHDVAAADVIHQVQSDKLTWIRAAGLSAPDLERLCQDFDIHPLAMEDVQHARQRPKTEAYPEMTFTVVRVPRWDDELAWVQVGLFLGRDFVITASGHKVKELDVIQERLLAGGPGSRTAESLFHTLLDALVDAWFPYMDELESHVEELEKTASQKADQETMASIRDAKQTVSRTRKVSSPMRDAVLALERGDHPHITPEAKLYLRDVSDHMVRIAERLDHVKEMSMFAQESWNATLANSQNQTMKRLTVVFALFLVPTFLAGLGGMNFEGVPAWRFQDVVATLLGLVAVGLGVSVWKKWL